MAQCTFVNDQGKQCQAKPVNGGDYCFWHDPKQRGARTLASQKGGQNRRLQGTYGDPIEITKPRDVERFLAQIINAVWTGKMPVQAGTSMGFLTKCWLDAFKQAEDDEFKNNYSPDRYKL